MGSYLYIDEVNQKTKIYHNNFICKKNIIIILNTLSTFCGKVNKRIKFFVEEMISPWMNRNIHIVTELSKIEVSNSKTQRLEEILIARVDLNCFFGDCHFEILCVIIYKLPKLRHDMLKKGLIFTLWINQVAKIWRKNHMIFHECFVNPI